MRTDIHIRRPAGGVALINGRTDSIESKSMGHRLLIAAMLSGVEIRVKNTSEDILATRDCLQALCSVQSKKELHCRESGSTLRFLLPVAAALGKQVVFVMEGRLSDRPLTGFREALEEHGIVLTKQDNRLSVRGRLSGGTYRLPGDISSQYVSGLLFALPLLSEDSRIEITGKLESEPYVHMTLDVLRQAGVRIIELETARRFEIPGGQAYHLPVGGSVEEDWSNHAVWLAMGAIGAGELINVGMRPDSLQGDRAICDVLSRFGAMIVTDETGRDIRAVSGRLRGIKIDASQIPDLVPILAVVAAAASGRTRIYNAARLRLKESDRLAAVKEVLTLLGVHIKAEDDCLEIEGGHSLHGNRVPSFGDHRIVMMAAAAALLCEEEIVIEGAQAVAKSYPHFFAECRRFGFVVTEEMV
ncbi:MAG: 3-phosphoshikimate 1-carboxyvinyltransferase [Lachnospiraceae bacterium]|nr:3-phosphoshikimate 1-carboxyvinyltransferase [Lachnospiraceae bacterium]MDY5741733.1 3-phosphoshikimate 1-carboxyvinyltransferase [Lachnospiraceae bacterium]